MLHQIVALIILSILGFFALKLFNKWKARQISNDEYILAKKILLEVLRLRNAVNAARIAVPEATEPPDSGWEELIRKWIIDIEKEKRKHAALQKTHHTRMDKVTQSIAAIQIELLEAEVFWGDELSLMISRMNPLITEYLFRAIELSLTLRDPQASEEDNETTKQEYDRIQVRYPNILIGNSVKEDRFKVELDAHLTEIETYLKRKMSPYL